MPYFATSQEWLHQSSLLLEARSKTTRITTKYKLPKPTDPSKISRKSRATKSSSAAPDGANTSAPETPAPAPPTALLVLKTYDPVSGVCLKYRTDQAAEVGRLVGIMGRLGRRMAGLSDVEPEESAPADVGGVEKGKETGRNTPVAEEVQAKGGQTGSGGGGGGAKKKKKGKK
ncbi:MAG: hypothetical protein M1820_001893 [Bogoriella megaspora]|nr:MAG: hypothetical protein M1820_001893 [Bogoriella megaspora]